MVCGYRLVKISYNVQSSNLSDVCSLRLDFDLFDIADPSDQTPVGNDGGQCLTDALVIATTRGRTYPTICGLNTGYHRKRTKKWQF